MEQLTGLGAGGIVIIAVIMLLRELKPLILRNNKSNSKPDILHHIERIQDAQTGRDTEMFRKMDKQTEVLHSIDTTQKRMCDKLDNLKDGGN